MKSRASTITAAVLAAILVLACGGNKVEPSEYADLGGTFEGSVTGTLQGGTFTGTGSLTVTQKEAGKLEGKASVGGKIVVMGQEVTLEPVPADFTGTVAKGGESPKVDISVSIDPDDCKTTLALSGTYTASTKALALTGGLKLTDDDCKVLDTLNLKLELAKK